MKIFYLNYLLDPSKVLNKLKEQRLNMMIILKDASLLDGLHSFKNRNKPKSLTRRYLLPPKIRTI